MTMTDPTATDQAVPTEGATGDPIEGDQGAPEAPEATKAGVGRGRSQVKYLGQEGFVGEILDELPEQERAARTAGESTLYHDMLVAVAEDEDNLGKWHLLADFGSVNGAQTVATNLNKQVAGKIGEGRGEVKPSEVKKLPEYEGWHFDFAGIKVPKKDAEGNVIEGERASRLYARMIEDEAAEVDQAAATTE